MSFDTLLAKANTGSGTDGLAGQNTPGGFAASVLGVNADGTSPEALVSESDMQALLVVMARLIDVLGALSPDALSRLRVNVETGNVTIASGTVNTVMSVGTVTTVTTVTNQAQVGGIAANQQIPLLNLLGEGDLRRNIVFS